MSNRATLVLITVGLLVATASAAAAQGKGPKKYAVTNDRALVVTREVLVRQGYDVVRIEDAGPDVVVWYRRGNMGRGKGKGRPVKMVIHREADRVVFLNTPSAILVDIDVRLKL
ncbi:MAG TPA: hypothetical protein VEK85_04595, partial [Gemmatimonadales bacterium]|nr:hypothetical protein [Gemmatimonadales bacterium]